MKIRDFKLERYYGRYEFTTAFQLSASDCASLTVAEVLELSGKSPAALLKTRLGYTETRGDPTLRAAIANFYPECDAADIVVCNAPQEAIFLTMNAVLEPGDRVVVMTPCYQSLAEVARCIGCTVVEWPVVEAADGWRLDLDALTTLLEPVTKLLVTNVPHNPTGLLPTPKEWQAIADHVSSCGVRWFSDEMYRGLEERPHDALAPAASLVADAVSLWGMSKSFGLPGLRIGWLACRDPGLLLAVERLKDYTSICSNALGEKVARLALDAADEILDQNRTLIAKNKARMARFAREHSGRLSWMPPRAGPVALARLHDESASAHADRVRREGDALLVPATLFDYTDRHLRIGLGRADFAAAIERWGRVLKTQPANRGPSSDEIERGHCANGG